MVGICRRYCSLSTARDPSGVSASVRCISGRSKSQLQDEYISMVWEDSAEKKQQIECKYAGRGQRRRVVEAQESTSRAKQLERVRPGRMSPKEEKLLRSTSTAVWANQRLRFLGGPPSAFRALPLLHPVLPPLRCGDRFSFPPLSSFRSSSLVLFLLSPSLISRQLHLSPAAHTRTTNFPPSGSATSRVPSIYICFLLLPSSLGSSTPGLSLRLPFLAISGLHL